MRNRPPLSASRIEPKTLGESKRGQQYQSIVPSVPTSAIECRSPMIPCSAIGKYADPFAFAWAASSTACAAARSSRTGFVHRLEPARLGLEHPQRDARVREQQGLHLVGRDHEAAERRPGDDVGDDRLAEQARDLAEEAATRENRQLLVLEDDAHLSLDDHVEADVELPALDDPLAFRERDLARERQKLLEVVWREIREEGEPRECILEIDVDGHGLPSVNRSGREKKAQNGPFSKLVFCATIIEEHGEAQIASPATRVVPRGGGGGGGNRLCGGCSRHPRLAAALYRRCAVLD